MSEPDDPIETDMAELSKYKDRFSASEGERAMLHGIRERIPPGGDVQVEGFVSPKHPEVFVGVHVTLLLVGGLIGFWWPIWGGVLTGASTLALLAETTGRFSFAHLLLVKVAAYNLVWRVRSKRPQATVVLTTPLDVPKYRKWETGWIRWTRRPLQWVFGAAMVLLSLMILRALGEPLGPRTRDLHLVAIGVLAVTVLVGLLAHRRESTGADSASGTALLLEIRRRIEEDPLPPGLDVYIGFLACSRAYQGGMRHFLDLHGSTLASPTLFISVQDPGREPLQAISSEGPIVSQVHRPTGPALAERLQWAGLNIPPTRSWQVSDAREAQRRGFRALSLTGGASPATAESTRRGADIVETLMRWYAHDVGQVQLDKRQLEALAATLPKKNTKRRK